jgi:hypothetical protein
LWFASPVSLKSDRGCNKCPRAKKGYSDKNALSDLPRELPWKSAG